MKILLAIWRFIIAPMSCKTCGGPVGVGRVDYCDECESKPYHYTIIRPEDLVPVGDEWEKVMPFSSKNAPSADS